MKLSICIPTYKRAELVESLVRSILQQAGEYEICVHVDGLVDDSLAKLESIRTKDKRLVISYDENRGRAHALKNSIKMARGRFIMIFDDDDYLYPEGLRQILDDCDKVMSVSSCGFIYHFEDNKGELIGGFFDVSTANFLSLRADYGIHGDKKEVVLANLLKDAVDANSHECRRIPTSLYWGYIAQRYDVECSNVVVGKKTYLAGGLTDGIKKIKKDNPQPLYCLYKIRMHSYFKFRYRSIGYFCKSLAGMIYYRFLSYVK